MKCEICGRIFEHNYNFWYHLRKSHAEISRHEYFDKFLKNDNNSTCKICGNACEWNEKTNSYKKFCSKKCRHEQYLITIKKNYNVSNVFQLESTKNKIKETISKKYNDNIICENISQTKHWHESIEKTKKEKYNGECWTNTEAVKNKTAETNYERYGCKAPLQNKDVHKKYEQTCLKVYGFTNAAANETVKEKIKNTFYKNYNGVHPFQDNSIMKKARKKYIYENENFSSSYELALYIWLKDHEIEFEYQPDVCFEYFFEDKKCIYHPDFRINNEFIEIKGLQFFENKDPNGKMFCPWRKKNDTSEIIEKRNAKYEAKHQCMIQNNVRIIIDCNKYVNYVKEKYGTNFLKQWRKK